MEISFPQKYLSLNPGELDLDFIFYLGDDASYCNKSMALLLSSRLQIESISNILISSFNIPIIEGIEGDITKLTDFICGQTLVLEKDEFPFFYYIASYLGINAILSAFQNESVKFDLDFSLKYGQQFFDFGADMLPFISAFAEAFPSILSNIEFQRLSLPIIDLTFQKVIPIPYSEEITSFILNHGGKLIRFLDFKQIPKDKIIEIILNKSNNLSYLKSNIISLLEKDKFLNVPPTKIFSLRGPNDFNGIIKFISTKTQGTPIEKGALSIEAGLAIAEQFTFQNVIEKFDSDNSFRTSHPESLNFTIDFLMPCVRVDGYSLRSGILEDDFNFPESWVIEGSNDKENWELIDVKKEIKASETENGGKTVSFIINERKNVFQYIRFRTLDEDENKKMCLECFEIFGELYEQKIASLPTQ
ncbi:F5/8 type C domain containing protein [Histomonas meleagridis]|uniref:F5/8 type C domain containing protein n=1 Tax=Histomonas meleagridis TaxID=135588 RepID=UPI00355941D6|nr:F5/8 type C domain containing protein [Histomonas meleagridis]KAH0797082.1 F5/8 type C domain containing protein [Histomonas meleagridis]